MRLSLQKASVKDVEDHTAVCSSAQGTLYVMFGSAAPHFYHTSRQDPGALFELRRWAAISLPTFQSDNTSAPGPSKFCASCQHFTKKKKKKADKSCDEWKHAYIQSSGSFKDYEPRMKKLFQGTLHMTVVFAETLISLKQDYDRPFYWSVIWSVCTQCWTTCWHVSLSFLRSSWRFDRWAALLWSLSASQGAQRDGKITPYKAN